MLQMLRYTIRNFCFVTVCQTLCANVAYCGFGISFAIIVVSLLL